MLDLDPIAEAIRLAYGESVSDTEPRTFWHIQQQPWETLSDERKKKWRDMALAAVEAYNARYEVE